MAKRKSSGRGSRRSRAESVTGAQEGAVETRAGELDLKPVEIAEDDVNMHVRAIKAATEKKDTAVSLLRGANKAAGKLHPELPAAIKAAIEAERANDPAKLKARLEVLGITLKATGCSVQLTVHDTLLGDVEEQAYKRGYADGEAGRTANNRYPEGSSLAEQYTKGWHHGTGKNLGMTPEQIDAARAEDDEHPDPDAENGTDADEGDDKPWPDDKQVAEQRQPELTH